MRLLWSLYHLKKHLSVGPVEQFGIHDPKTARSKITSNLQPKWYKRHCKYILCWLRADTLAAFHFGERRHNRTQPSLVLLVTPVFFLLLKFKICAVKKNLSVLKSCYIIILVSGY